MWLQSLYSLSAVAGAMWLQSLYLLSAVVGVVWLQSLYSLSAVVGVVWLHHPVEGPHVEVVEQLGEQLDGERRVHATPS